MSIRLLPRRDHDASGRSPRHPGCLGPAIPLRCRHSTGTSGKLAAASLVQCELPKRGDALIVTDAASIAPCQGKYVRRLGSYPLREWPNEPTSREFSINHRGPTERDTK